MIIISMCQRQTELQKADCPWCHLERGPSLNSRETPLGVQLGQ